MSAPTRIGVVGAALSTCLRMGARTPAMRPPEAVRPARSHDETLDAGEAEDAEPKTERSPWNEIDLYLFTVRVRRRPAARLRDVRARTREHEQMPVSADVKVRDFRFLLKGDFKFVPRAELHDRLHVRRAKRHVAISVRPGLMVDIPELGGDLFVGRTKEGFSTNKMMVGYNGWTIERSAANDAFLPILADGVKWTGTAFGGHIVYNVGWFIDTLSETESFNKNDRQFAARAVGLPFAHEVGRRCCTSRSRRATARRTTASCSIGPSPSRFSRRAIAVDTGKFARHSIDDGRRRGSTTAPGR